MTSDHNAQPYKNKLYIEYKKWINVRLPAAAIIGLYRFFFYSSDRAEPYRIHMPRERFAGKFWLNPTRLEKSKGFSDHELFQIQKVIERNEQRFLEKWHECLVCAISFGKNSLLVDLSDGRRICIPLAWYPRLMHATKQERERYELIGDGEGIHWPELDEDISVEGILAGRPSQESQPSLQKWIKAKTH